MALQNGFKIIDIDVQDGGGGFGSSTSYNLFARDSSGQGSGFSGTAFTNSNGIITSASISNKGLNYSSGSWASAAPAIKGEFTSLAIQNAPGSGAVLIPTIGMDISMSISDINVERGVGYNTSNSDIHDLYSDFAAVGGLNVDGTNVDVDGEVIQWNKPNFDWYDRGPVSGAVNQDNQIRFDEFYGSTYDTYGGRGCLALGTKILMSDGTSKNIEDIDVGDEIRCAQIDGMPLDFDHEDTWKNWIGIPKLVNYNNKNIYDVQKLNLEDTTNANVFDVYFDYYDNYYKITTANRTITATWEHPFFVMRSGGYFFRKTNQIMKGDLLLTSQWEFEEVLAVTFVDEELETVNLNVEPYDVYFADGILVHNVHDK